MSSARPADLDHAFNAVAAACRAFLGQAAPTPLDDDAWLLARRHGVLPLMSDAGRPERRAQLHAIARRQLDHCHELQCISAALDGHLDFIALKGPALAVQLYGSAARRESRDLDLLVRPDDVPTALAELRALGFTLQGQPMEQRGFRHYLRTQHEIPLYHPRTDVWLELQWAWAQHHFAVDRPVDACFGEAAAVQVGGCSVKSLSAEDTLLYLAVHGAKHGWSTLSLVTDFAAAALRLGADLQVVLERAESAGLSRLLAIGAHLSRALLDLPLPLDQQPASTRLARNFEKRLREDGARGSALRLYVQSRERFSDRLRVVWRSAVSPSPSDTGWVVLPDRWFGAYYLLRPIRLLWQPTGRLLHRSSADELSRDHVFGNLANREASLLEQSPSRR